MLPLYLGLALLFLALALLSAFLIAGESRRARILVEYEADRIASALLDSFRAQGEIDPADLDPRILGFGLYRADGARVAGLGETPRLLRPEDGAGAFRYDDARRTLVLARPLEGPGLMPMMGRRGRGQSGLFYLSMGIGGYYRSRILYGAAMVLVPVIIAALAAAFLSLLVSNLRFRRRAMEQETLARLGESARTLAHEIRNPLGAIRLQTGLLRKRLPGAADKELDAIEEETERLNALTRRVGDFLRNPLGNPERVDLTEFLGELAGRLPYPLALPAGARGAVVFDRELLRSVLENLARNAYESYGESGGEVEATIRPEGGRVVVEILDRGAGIPQELSASVFDPFFTSKSQGSGIGLPLARRFVEAAGGELTLLPRQGGGTVARVSLPQAEPR